MIHIRNFFYDLKRMGRILAVMRHHVTFQHAVIKNPHPLLRVGSSYEVNSLCVCEGSLDC